LFEELTIFVHKFSTFMFRKDINYIMGLEQNNSQFEEFKRGS